MQVQEFTAIYMIIMITITMLYIVATTPALPLPAEWTQCRADSECTYVSLGCCDTTPVNRTNMALAQKRLEDSGRPYCPVKAACGPSADGTWANAPGTCVKRVCVLR